MLESQQLADMQDRTKNIYQDNRDSTILSEHDSDMSLKYAFYHTQDLVRSEVCKDIEQYSSVWRISGTIPYITKQLEQLTYRFSDNTVLEDFIEVNATCAPNAATSYVIIKT